MVDDGRIEDAKIDPRADDLRRDAVAQAVQLNRMHGASLASPTSIGAAPHADASSAVERHLARHQHRVVHDGRPGAAAGRC